MFLVIRPRHPMTYLCMFPPVGYLTEVAGGLSPQGAPPIVESVFI